VATPVPRFKQADTSSIILDHLDAGHYLFECGEFNRAFKLLGSSSESLWRWGKARESIAILVPFQREDVKKQMETQLVGWLLGILGNAHTAIGQVPKAIGYHKQALAIAREYGHRRKEGLELDNLGLAYAPIDQEQKSIEYTEQALAIAREFGDRRGEGHNLGMLGSAYKNPGQEQKAKEYLSQSLKIFEEFNSPRAEIIRQWLGELE